MTENTNIALELKHKFDPERMRHYLNKHLTVLHCHHYSSLYTQLALDAGETDLLVASSEASFRELIADYFEDQGVTGLEEKIHIACEYFSAMGLGKMKVQFLGDESGEVILERSHVDEGWIKKWSKTDKPVNYIGCGYISAMFSAILDQPIGVFFTREQESIVMGAEKSVFKVYKQ